MVLLRTPQYSRFPGQKLLQASRKDDVEFICMYGYNTSHWLALRYASQRGRIHRGLVETLFRYNGRSRMGGFLQRLQNLCDGADALSPHPRAPRLRGS